MSLRRSHQCLLLFLLQQRIVQWKYLSDLFKSKLPTVLTLWWVVPVLPTNSNAKAQRWGFSDPRKSVPDKRLHVLVHGPVRFHSLQWKAMTLPTDVARRRWRLARRSREPDDFRRRETVHSGPSPAGTNTDLTPFSSVSSDNFLNKAATIYSDCDKTHNFHKKLWFSKQNAGSNCPNCVSDFVEMERLTILHRSKHREHWKPQTKVSKAWAHKERAYFPLRVVWNKQVFSVGQVFCVKKETFLLQFCQFYFATCQQKIQHDIVGIQSFVDQNSQEPKQCEKQNFTTLHCRCSFK